MYKSRVILKLRDVHKRATKSDTSGHCLLIFVCFVASLSLASSQTFSAASSAIPPIPCFQRLLCCSAAADATMSIGCRTISLFITRLSCSSNWAALIQCNSRNFLGNIDFVQHFCQQFNLYLVFIFK